jgi:hypothetical protein
MSNDELKATANPNDPSCLAPTTPNKVFPKPPHVDPQNLQSTVNWIEQDSADEPDEYLEACNTRQSGE